LIDRALKLARIRKCRFCEFRRTAPSTLWKWPRCKAGGVDAKGDPLLELTDEFMEGPASNCPQGFWKDLEPIDLEENEATKRRAAYLSWPNAPVRKLLLRLFEYLYSNVDRQALKQRLIAALTAGETELWILLEVIGVLVYRGVVDDSARKALLSDGAKAILAFHGNDQAYYALRDCVEAGVCTKQEAQDVAQELGITKPTSGA